MFQRLVLVGRLIVVLTIAALAGVVMTITVALIGHEILVRMFGDDLASIERTLPWIVALGSSYVAGMISALVVGAVAWRRLVRR